MVQPSPMIQKNLFSTASSSSEEERDDRIRNGGDRISMFKTPFKSNKNGSSRFATPPTVTQMTPSPIRSPLVSQNPGTAPTRAPEPDQLLSSSSTFADVQSGYLHNHDSGHSMTLFRHDNNNDRHVITRARSRRKSRASRRYRLSETLLLDTYVAAPVVERRRSSSLSMEQNTSSSMFPRFSFFPELSSEGSSENSPRHSRSTPLESYGGKKPIGQRRNLSWIFVGMILLSTVGMILLTPYTAETSFEPAARPDIHLSAAGLRGKMVQGHWEEKSSPKSKGERKLKAETKPKLETKVKKETKPKVEDKPKASSKAKVEDKPKASRKAKAEEKPKAETKAKKESIQPKIEEKAKKESKATEKEHLPAKPDSKKELPKSSEPTKPSEPSSKSSAAQKMNVNVPRFHSPPPISKVSKKFENQDQNLYGRQSSKRRRVVAFDPSFQSSLPSNRRIKAYPADFTDNTQLYPILDSSDERLSRMEIRDPYSEGECVPMQDWQTTFHPECNGMHELAIENLGEDNLDDANLFGTKGFWRNAWKLDVHNVHKRDTVVLKTLKFEHNFEDAHFEHDRVDAVAMERLTSSPHVINIFGFCGHSVISEYADGSRVGELADKAKKTPLERLRIASDIAHGLADVHGIDGDGNATFVHLDVNPANVVSVGGTLKLNDFNIGIIRRWNTTSNSPCGFPTQYPNPQWRSPEEALNSQNLTEKVDVFSMGHIFFRLVCGHEPWNKLEPGGKPLKDDINGKVKKGVHPFIPDHVTNSENPEVIAIRDAMMDCYTFDPVKRPSARSIANRLDEVLKNLSKSESK